MLPRGFAGLLVLVLVVTSFGVVAALPATAASSSPTIASPVNPPAAAVTSADLGWTTPNILDQQTPTNANFGSVALAGDHSGMILWEKDGLYATIMATHFVPGGGDGNSNWQAPLNLSSPGCNEYNPVVAMNATGTAIAAWWDGCYAGIEASVYRPNLGWTYSGFIDQSGSGSYSPQISMNAAGFTVVTWENWDGSAHHPYANWYTPGSGWATPTRLDTSTNDTWFANVGVDGRGNAIVTYYRYESGNYHVFATRFSAGTWSAPFKLESSTSYAYAPRISVDSQGNAVVAWYEEDSAYVWSIVANRYDNATATWSGQTLIESQTSSAFYWEALSVSANNGSAVVAWEMYGPGSDPYSVWANHYTAGVGWGTEADVDLWSGSTYVGNAPSVSLDSQGNATIAYQLFQIVPTGSYPTWIDVIRYSALTGGVTAWWQIDGQRTGDGVPVVAEDTSGNALVVWNYNEATVTSPVNGILTRYYKPTAGWVLYSQAEWDENVQPGWMQLESNAAGDAIYSWTQYDGPLWHGYASIYTPATGWSKPAQIEHMDYSSVGEEWSAIDGQGNAIVLFKAYDGTQWNIYAAYYSVQTGWKTPVRVDTASGSAKYWLRVALNRDGNGVACWQEFNGIGWNAYTSFFNGTTKAWSAPIAVQSQFSTVYSVVVGIDGHGNAMAAYQAYNGSGTPIYASYFQPSSGWGSPVLLSKHSAYMGSVPGLMASNDQGDFAVSWNEWDGARYTAVASVFTPQSGWSSDAFLAAGPGGSNPATPSLDGAGDAMVVYDIWDGVQNDAYAVTRPAGGAWSAPELLSSGYAAWNQVTSSLDYHGNGYAAWTQFNGHGWDIWARRFIWGQGWLPARVINSPAPANDWTQTTPSTDTGNPLLATDGHGDAILGWIEWHDNALVPYAAEYTVGDGSPNLKVNSPNAGTITNDSQVSISGTTDPGSTIAVNGTSVPVAADGSFRDALTLADGTYTFTVTATDAAGLTTTVARTITVDTTAPALHLASPSTGLLTRDPVVLVSGTTEPNATVVVNGVDAAVSPSGQFSVEIGLQEGTNAITATATDAAGNQAQTSVSVTLDTTPPAIAITSPGADANVSVPTVTITGTAEPGASVLVNGHPVTVDSSGSFSAQISLSEGANLITATATDAAGNSASTVVVVTYTNPGPAAAVQSSLGSLNTMDLGLIVLVIASLALGVFEMIQIRRLQGRKGPPPAKPESPKTEGPKPPQDDL